MSGAKNGFLIGNSKGFVLLRRLTERKLPRAVDVFSYVNKEGKFWPVRTAQKIFLKKEHPDEV